MFFMFCPDKGGVRRSRWHHGGRAGRLSSWTDHAVRPSSATDGATGSCGPPPDLEETWKTWKRGKVIGFKAKEHEPTWNMKNQTIDRINVGRCRLVTTKLFPMLRMMPGKNWNDSRLILIFWHFKKMAPKMSKQWKIFYPLRVKRYRWNWQIDRIKRFINVAPRPPKPTFTMQYDRSKSLNFTFENLAPPPWGARLDVESASHHFRRCSAHFQRTGTVYCGHIYIYIYIYIYIFF